MGDIVGALVVAVLMMVAVSPVFGVFLYNRYQTGQRYRQLRGTAVETPDTITPEETVFVRGTVTATGESVTGPVSGTETALAAWVVREWYTGDGNYWMPKARGIESGGIHLGGSAGRVAIPDLSECGQTDTGTRVAGVGAPSVRGVEADDAVVETDAFDTDTEISPEESTPSRFATLEQRVGLDSPVERWSLPVTRDSGTRNYREVTVDTGDTVTVYGRVEATDRPGAAPTVAPPEDDPLLVSTLEPDDLVGRYRWSYWRGFYGVLAVLVLIGAFAGTVAYI